MRVCENPTCSFDHRALSKRQNRFCCRRCSIDYFNSHTDKENQKERARLQGLKNKGRVQSSEERLMRKESMANSEKFAMVTKSDWFRNRVKYGIKTSDKWQKSNKSDAKKEKLREIAKKRIGYKNPFYGKKHSIQTRKKISDSLAKAYSSGGGMRVRNKRGIKGWYCSNKQDENFYFDSFYEYLRMKMLDSCAEVISWTKKHKICIPYEINGIERMYVPDFKIVYSNGDIVLEEIKGYENLEKKFLKYDALKKYCRNHDMLYRIIEHDQFSDMCISHFGRTIATLRKEFKNE